MQIIKQILALDLGQDECEKFVLKLSLLLTLRILHTPRSFLSFLSVTPPQLCVIPLVSFRFLLLRM